MANPLLSSCLFLLVSAATVHAFPENNIWRLSNPPNKLIFQAQAVASNFREGCQQILQGKLGIWQMAAVLSVFPCVWFLRRQTIMSNARDSETNDAEAVDPALLKRYSEFRTYSTRLYTYPSLRIFFRAHPQADKLPLEPAPLPLLVFIHGLGGSAAQFNPLLTSLVNIATCLSFDLPGCGLSEFDPKLPWSAYTIDTLAELIANIIEDYRDKKTGQGVVLIGHSLGCSLAVKIASTTALPQPSALSQHVVGLVAICPPAEPPKEEQVALFRKLLWIPGSVFDLWRRWDRRGGHESPSVHRFVGADADEETKKLQERFNSQSRTPVWRRMASGTLPVYENHVIKSGGLPGRETWEGLNIPTFLIAGEGDNVTKPTEIVKIAEFMGKSHPVQIELNDKSQPIVDSAAPIDLSNDNHVVKLSRSKIDLIRDDDFLEKETTKTEDSDPTTPDDGGDSTIVAPPQSTKPRRVLKTTIMPAPASHALLYMPSTVRTLAGLISDFLCSQVSPRFSLGWQLQFLSTSGKWDVKNLKKWEAVAPVSEPIAGIFRAMKTLREVDEFHCPEVFVRQWGEQLKDIIDISHEVPAYDPRGLEKGGIHYHKFATVSKIPPTDEEVDVFVALIDRLREEQRARAKSEMWGSEYYIGVHCHYGFNRTGYFIACYLIERCGYNVQAAINEFAKRRPKGIKHEHFKDRLWLRYCIGLKRAPTL